MIRDVRRSVGADDPRFTFRTFDCHRIPFPDASFDLVIANHVLFYCSDILQVCREVCRVLVPGGTFCCSTYGTDHMQEIGQLVQKFDSHIVLSADHLYEKFGLEDGTESRLQNCFTQYPPDALRGQSARQSSRTADRIHLSPAMEIKINICWITIQEFREFVEKKTDRGFRITKDAGIFLCQTSK